MTHPNRKILAFFPLFWAVLAIVSPPQIAWADSAADADAAISKGIEMRRQGKNAEALELFQKAYRLVPSPRAKTQIALAEQAIGRWADAERDLAEAMSQASDPWIARQRTVLTEAMGVIRRHLGALIVTGEPAGAIVVLDCEPVGTIPLPERRATAGEVVVTVRAQGFVSVTRKVMVTPGELAAEVFRLKHIERDSAGWGLGSSRGQSEAVRLEPPPAVGLSTTPPDEPATSGGRGRLRMAAWGTGIGGGALLVAGGTLLLLAEHTVHKFDDHCFIDADTNAVRGGGDCSDLNDTVHRDRVIGVIGLAIGAAAAATSAVLFYKTWNSAGKSTRAQALAECAPTAGLGVACVWRF